MDHQALTKSQPQAKKARTDAVVRPQSDGQGPAQPPREVQTVDAYRSGRQHTGERLFRGLLTSTQRNTLCCTSNVLDALALVAPGTAGHTREALRPDLSWAVMPPPGAPSDEALDPQMKAAKSAWVGDAIELRPAYVSALATQNGTLRRLPRPPEAAARAVNDWAREATDGAFEKVVSPQMFRGGPEQLLLTVACAIDAKWAGGAMQVDPYETTFRAAAGVTQGVSMLLANKRLPALDEAGLAAVQLPYRGDRLRLNLMLLPHDAEARGLDASAQLTRVCAELAEASPRKVEVRFPPFEFEAENDLKRCLPSMGAAALQDDVSVNFGNLSTSDLYIQKFVEKARITVDKEGTRAASFVSCRMIAKGPGVPEPVLRMTFNRPFYFAIVDRAKPVFVGYLAHL